MHTKGRRQIVGLGFGVVYGNTPKDMKWPKVSHPLYPYTTLSGIFALFGKRFGCFSQVFKALF